MTIPENTRLDNAALIYPPCMTSKHTTVFRMSITLTEDIDPACLQTSLICILDRFPTFGYTIGTNFFWWYLKQLNKFPIVTKSEKMGRFDYRKSNGFLFHVGYEGKRIDLDVFHALTDGTGAMTFLISLVAEYLRNLHGVETNPGKWILKPEDEPTMEEFEDSFDHFSGEKGSLDKEEKAFALKGKVRNFSDDGRTRIPLSASKLKAASQKYGCTVTELIVSAIIYSLQELRSRQRKPGSHFIRVEVPVNLRPIFSRRTLRNFSSYLHLGIDVRNGDIPFEEIVRDIHLQKNLYIQPRYLKTRIAANVSLEDSKFIAMAPRFIKKPVMRFINNVKGDRYCTTTLSNLGRIELPEKIARYISDMDFVLGTPLRRGAVCACVSFKDQLVLNISSRLKETDFESILMRNLSLATGDQQAASFGGTAGKDMDAVGRTGFDAQGAAQVVAGEGDVSCGYIGVGMFPACGAH